MLSLLQFWRPLGLSLLVAAALAYRALLVHQRDAARAQAARLGAELAAAQAASAAMRQAVAAQNAAVARLRVELRQSAEAAAARDRAAAAEGAAVMRQAAAGARALQRARIDAGCAAAIRWGNVQSAKLARW
ncbi:MAG TPA: hypothetical protein VFB33_05625 [Candidatus Binataceae bacterium]|nr:hypothetical protein [Candidatus Binataceae bacterium]